jgi:uncharacterized protein
MSKLIRVVAALVFALLPALARAQAWPAYENTYVNDYANVIAADAEARLTVSLRSLREETGIEATVLTLYTRRGYEDPGTLEKFATGLFNAWGIGNAETNDGILVLVLPGDRTMRVELGSGYGAAFNRAAQDIIDTIFLPAFRDGDYSGGIEAGTEAVIARIARVHYQGGTPNAGNHDLIGRLIVAAIGAVVAAGVGAMVFARRISDRFTRCPQCGQRGIHTVRNILDRASRSSTGRGEKIVTCRHCDYRDTLIYTIPIITSSSSSSSGSGGSFGGGSSSGGGASGSW